MLKQQGLWLVLCCDVCVPHPCRQQLEQMPGASGGAPRTKSRLHVFGAGLQHRCQTPLQARSTYLPAERRCCCGCPHGRLDAPVSRWKASGQVKVYSDGQFSTYSTNCYVTFITEPPGVRRQISTVRPGVIPAHYAIQCAALCAIRFTAQRQRRRQSSGRPPLGQQQRRRCQRWQHAG